MKKECILCCWFPAGITGAFLRVFCGERFVGWTGGVLSRGKGAGGANFGSIPFDELSETVEFGVGGAGDKFTC